MSAPADRRCIDCGHTFREAWPKPGEPWTDPTCCQACGCEETDVLVVEDLAELEALAGRAA